jgi:hypothetical protein
MPLPPEACVGHASGLFDSAGVLRREDTRPFFQSFVTFATWIEAVAARPILRY